MKNKKGSVSLKRELRLSMQPQKFEIRKTASGTTISGYAAVFESLSQDMGGWREKIQRGAFAQSLKDNPDVLCLYSHDESRILGRVSSGSLLISEDQTGLRFECTLPDTTTARDLIALMERGDLSHMSFGFVTLQDDWQDVEGQVVRTLIECLLYEVSVVGSPAYLGTSVSVNLRSCPTNLRSHLKRDDDVDDLNLDCDGEDIDDPRCEDREERCQCECQPCQDGDCEDCDNTDCEGDDDDCEGCPMQDDQRSDSLRIRQLFTHRMNA